MRKKLDPLHGEQHVDDVAAYGALNGISARQLDGLIDLLIVSLLTGHLQRPTPLVSHLAAEFEVDIRADWTPDAAWLGSYQKIQLAHLVTELLGPAHAPPPDKKKSELVEQLSNLFATAAAGKLPDKTLAEKLNAWQPANLRSTNIDK